MATVAPSRSVSSGSPTVSAESTVDAEPSVLLELPADVVTLGLVLPAVTSTLRVAVFESAPPGSVTLNETVRVVVDGLALEFS
jgi:hypothetical protein